MCVCAARNPIFNGRVCQEQQVASTLSKCLHIRKGGQCNLERFTGLGRLNSNDNISFMTWSVISAQTVDIRCGQYSLLKQVVQTFSKITLMFLQLHHKQSIKNNTHDRTGIHTLKAIS